MTFTVYMNYYMFYGTTNKNAGDAEYDHIVSVSSISSQYDDDLYHDTDVITLEDHGVWAPIITGPVYLFNYTFQNFQGSRQEANAPNGNIYTLPSSKTTANYGIAHTGVTDETGELLPVSIQTSENYEDPVIKNRSEDRPAAMPLKLTVTVRNLVNGVDYVMYRYNAETSVPTSAFNKNSKSASQTYTFKGTAAGTYTVTESIMSSDKVIFRAVRADAA